MNDNTHNDNSQEKIYKFPKPEMVYEIHTDLGKGQDFSAETYMEVYKDFVKIISTKILYAEQKNN